jgi:cysteinyl-tRNA synthetase
LDSNNVSKKEASQIYSLLTNLNLVLGVVSELTNQEDLPRGAQELITKREEARKIKDWKTADALRQQLKDMGIIIEDTKQGVTWKIEKS